MTMMMLTCNDDDFLLIVMVEMMMLICNDDDFN